MATAVLLALGVGVVLITTLGTESERHNPARAAHGVISQAGVGAAPAVRLRPPFAVGLRVIRLVDHSRHINLPSGARVPRALTTFVWYPAVGSPSAKAGLNATPQLGAGPFPLVVFGHGFELTPGPYSRLLEAWARAGFVVAAPRFPLENAHAPGGPDESDLINQPADMSFVISRLLSASGRSGAPLQGLIDPQRIAVSGHSDGGETALAVAYYRRFRDPRVDAAAILSGARIPGVTGFSFPPSSPPLLAAQGTADTINPPGFTSSFYDAASPPKFLLTLFGAEHLPPYTYEQPQLRIVERVTIAFFDRYLKQAGPVSRLVRLGTVRGISSLTAQP